MSPYDIRDTFHQISWNLHRYRSEIVICVGISVLDKVAQTLRSLFYKFKFFSQILNRKTLRTVYFGLVESPLIYEIIAWDSSTSYSHIKGWENIQNSFIKIMMHKDYFYHSEKLYYILNVWYQATLLFSCDHWVG